MWDCVCTYMLVREQCSLLQSQKFFLPVQQKSSNCTSVRQIIWVDNPFKRSNGLSTFRQCLHCMFCQKEGGRTAWKASVIIVAVSDANTVSLLCGTCAKLFSGFQEGVRSCRYSKSQARLYICIYIYMLNMHRTYCYACVQRALLIKQVLSLPVFMHCLVSACESFLHTEG